MSNNNFLEFSKRLEEKDVNFHLAYDTKNSFSVYGPFSLFILDAEDIQYLKNKYLPKVNDQFQEELKNLRKKFNKGE